MKTKNEMLVIKEEIWRNFLTQGVCQNHIVAAEITDSWLRCSKIGVNANDGKAYNVLEEHDIRHILEQKRDIIEIALPFMRKLYGLFQNSGFIIVLSDENGYVMESFGDTDCMSDARKIRFIKGASWQEIEVGTNAIALALLSGKAVQMSGAEHYCKKHHCFTCSAAPIYSYNGSIIAVLDLSGPAQASYSHTLGMVAAAANAISMQIGIQQKNYELSLMNKRFDSIFSTMSDGIILFDKSGIIKEFNPVAKKILEKNGLIKIGTEIDTIFAGKNELIKNLLAGEKIYSDVEVKIDNDTKISRCMISGEAIIDKNGFASGGIIVLRPIEKVKCLANQFSNHSPTFKFDDIIGDSPEILEAIHLAKLAANNMSNVILQGESGTGKEMFAQSIHNKSSRCKGPFIALNCGAIPRELVESELFGYEYGSFTGAKRGGKAGNFELASGGTLFLDEIGDMPLEQQVALLRVLQEKKFTRVGGSKVIPADVRIICATNKNLYKQIEERTFRQDLYYRLNVFNIEIPPLRERRTDISLLFQYFTEKFGNEQGNAFSVEQDVLNCIEQYNWPGNVRELHNVAERTCNLAENHIITLSCLPPEFRCLQQKLSPVNLLTQVNPEANQRSSRKDLFAEQERQEILLLLEKENGNISRVAGQLGIARSTLYRKMKQYTIDD